MRRRIAPLVLVLLILSVIFFRRGLAGVLPGARDG